MEMSPPPTEKRAPKIAAVVLAGGLALAGCSNLEQGHAPIPDVAPIAVEIDPSIDQWPKVKTHDALPEPSSVHYIDATTVSRAIKNRGGKGEQRFSRLFNTDGNDATHEYALPDGVSAPLLDIKLGRDGELHYNDFIDSAEPDNNIAILLKTVSSTSPLLLPALRAGEVQTVHLRIFDPETAEEQDESLRSMQQGMFVPRDFNDGGTPSIYLYMPAKGLQDTQTTQLSIEHELNHGMLRQYNLETGEAVSFTDEERTLFTEACAMLRGNALEKVQRSGSSLLSSLRRMRSMSKPALHESYDKVIDAIGEGTYQNLPVHPVFASSLPACYLQNPWQAISVDLQAKKVGHDRLLPGVSPDAFTEVSAQMNLEWQGLIKDETLYGGLSESTHLKRDAAHRLYGHPYDNAYELAASSTNLAIRLPAETGALVACGTEAQSALIQEVVRYNIQKLKDTHPLEGAFHKYLDTQLAIFIAAATR